MEYLVVNNLNQSLTLFMTILGYFEDNFNTETKILRFDLNYVVLYLHTSVRGKLRHTDMIV